MWTFGVHLKPGCLIHVQTVQMEVKSVHVAFISIGDPCINAKTHQDYFPFLASEKLFVLCCNEITHKHSY
jgi:hypothetical protein